MKFDVAVFVALATQKGLEHRFLKRSSCNVPVRIGSKLVISGPLPRVDTTKPPVPVPAPPAATEVPPWPEPTCVPSPPTPPPGVFCTTPLFTPRMLAPALERQISVSAMFRL